MSAWPEPVERVASFLREAGAEARIEELGGSTASAEDAARAVGCEPGQVVKTLVFDCDGTPALVLVPGDRRADASKIAAATGAATARIAGAERVEQVTGFPPGAVAPFPTAPGRRVLIERTLLARPLVWVGAGSTRHLAGIAPPELVRLAGATAMDAVTDPT